MVPTDYNLTSKWQLQRGASPFSFVDPDCGNQGRIGLWIGL
jgi:hypothetical protein